MKALSRGILPNACSRIAEVDRRISIPVCVVLSVPLAFVIEALYRWMALSAWPTDFSIEVSDLRRLVLFAVVSMFLLLHVVFRPWDIWTFIYRFRYLLAALVFATCVILELHGSSMSAYNVLVQPNNPLTAAAQPIIGVPRGIRSDEYMVFTPLSLSQAYTGYAPINSIAEAWPTTMMAHYGQPVWDISTIAKPFFWGYLLLGSARGLAWFWCGRLIGLLLVTFECLMIVTRKDKLLSFAGAMLITLSPLVQWWFSINGLVEMLCAGQLAIIMTYLFLNTRQTVRKLVYVAVFALCACAFVFTLYPAWMVPLAYFFVALFVWVLIENAGNGMRSRPEWLYLVGAIGIAGLILLHWYGQISSTYTIMQNTVYPGQRVTTGGGGWREFFDYTAGLATPYLDTSNPVESAAVLGFFPIPEMLAVVILVRKRFKDPLLLLVLLVEAVIGVFVVFGFPVWLARLSLLSYTTVPRVVVVVGLAEVFIFMRTLSDHEETIFKSTKLRVAGVVVLVALSAGIVAKAGTLVWWQYMPTGGYPRQYLVLLFVLMCLFISLFFIRRTALVRRLALVGFLIVSLVGGAFVNPLMSTIDVITQKPLFQFVKAQEAADPGVWIADSNAANLLIAAGAPTINSTNIVPVLSRWALLDPSGEYAGVYNMYAHIQVAFDGSDASTFEGPDFDTFYLDLAMSDIPKLGINYICVKSDTVFPNVDWGNHLEEIYNEAGMAVYKVVPNSK